MTPDDRRQALVEATIPLLHERMNRGRLAAVTLGFVGILVILRPGVETLQPASLLVLGVAFSFALVGIITKHLTKTESTFSILFFMNLMQFVPNFAGAGRAFWLKLGPVHAAPLAAICLGGLFSHLCLTNAYRYGDATIFFSRMLPIIRTFISLPAGVAKMPFWRFTILTTLGCIPWVLMLALMTGRPARFDDLTDLSWRAEDPETPFPRRSR